MTKPNEWANYAQYLTDNVFGPQSPVVSLCTAAAKLPPGVDPVRVIEQVLAAAQWHASGICGQTVEACQANEEARVVSRWARKVLAGK